MNFEINSDGVLVKYLGHAATVVIPEGVTSIGAYVFCDCPPDQQGNPPKKQPMYKGKEIISSCFVDNTSKYSFIEKVVPPDSLVNIEEYAFYGCRNLKRITFNDGLKNIGRHSFSRCRNLQKIVCPSSLNSIDSYAFADCYFLKKVVLNAGIKTIGCGAFCLCSNLEDLVIPDGITTIGSYAFPYCRSLKKVVFPDSLISVEDFAFRGCGGLEKIAFNDGLKTIGLSAFCSCKSLVTVEIPGSVTSVDFEAFGDCDRLTGAKFFSSDTKIDRNAFHDSPNIFYYDFPDGKKLIPGRKIKAETNFELEIIFTSTDDKTWTIRGQANTEEVKYPDYFEGSVIVKVSPKQLGTAGSIAEVVELLRENVIDDYGEEVRVFDDSRMAYFERYGYRVNPLTMLADTFKSMDDIKAITIRGDEEDYDVWENYFYRTYTYDRQTGKYYGTHDGYAFDYDGKSGGDLLFDVSDCEITQIEDEESDDWVKYGGDWDDYM